MSHPLPPVDAVLLLSFGGPEGPDDVVPFLEKVTRGRNIHELLSAVKRPAILRLSRVRLVARTGHRFVRATVVAIDPRAARVITADGRQVGFDACIIAVGGVNDTFGVPGAERYAMPFKSVDHCEAIGRTLARLARRSGARCMCGRQCRAGTRRPGALSLHSFTETHADLARRPGYLLRFGRHGHRGACVGGSQGRGLPDHHGANRPTAGPRRALGRRGAARDRRREAGAADTDILRR